MWGFLSLRPHRQGKRSLGHGVRGARVAAGLFATYWGICTLKILVCEHVGWELR